MRVGLYPHQADTVLPLWPLMDSGHKPACGGHAPSGLGQYGLYPLDADTVLPYPRQE